MTQAAPIRAAGAMIVGVASTACGSPLEAPETVALEPFAEVSAPLSDNHDVAVVSQETACVIESFEYRVICRTLDGVTVGTFGRQGEGPGEFLFPSIVRQSHGRVATWDVRLGRVSVFDPDGTAVSEFPVSGRFHVNGISAMGVHGAEGFGPGTDGPLIENQVRDAATGEIVWRRSIYETADTECGSVGPGMPYLDGGFVFWACQGALVFLADRDTEAARVVMSPTYAAELPNQRDIDAYLGDMAKMAGTMSMPRSAMEPYAAAFRETPKKLFHVPRTFNTDGQGRLWVATTRDRDAFSYFDIWSGTEHVGTARIRDRLMGYDILDSTLVVLVERKPDRDGIAQRALDWYHIGGVGFGVRDR